MNKTSVAKLVSPDSKSVFFEQGIALFLWCVMICLELSTQTTVSPLISMMCFGVFANRMRPALVSLWVCIFCLTSLFLLLQDPMSSISRSTVLVRFGTILVGGLGSVVISFNRLRITDSFLQTIRVLEKLPAPIIISDCNGSVLFMNDNALRFFDVEPDHVKGASYFAYMGGEDKGPMIQKYFDFVESNQTTLNDMTLHLSKPFPVKIQATFVSIDGKFSRLVATVFGIQMENSDEEKAVAVESSATQADVGH